MIKETAVNTFAQVLAKLVSAGISLVIMKHLIAQLGLDQYGVFTLLSSAYLIFDILADFGTKTIAVRELRTTTLVDKVLNNLVVLRVGLSIFVFVLGSGFVVWNSALSGYRLVAWEALWMLFLTNLAGTLEFVCQIRGRLVIKSLVDVIFSLGGLVLLMNPFNQRLAWVYAIYIFSRIISLLIGFGFVPIKIDYKLWDRWEMKRLFISSLPMGLYMLLFTAYDRSVDTWLINHFWAKENVAVYGVAYKIYNNLVLPAYFFMNSVFPYLSSGLEKDKKLVVKKMLPWLMSGCVVVIAATWLFSLRIMEIIIPNRAILTAGILNVLAIALMFSYMNHMFGFFLIAKGRPAQLLVLGMVGLVINIMLNLILIPSLGPVGGAWATVGTEASMCIGLICLYQTRT